MAWTILIGKKTGKSIQTLLASWLDVFPEAEENGHGMALRGARTKEDVRQEDLAQRTGIPQRHISEMENGKRPIGKKNAKILSKALNIDYRVFL